MEIINKFNSGSMVLGNTVKIDEVCTECRRVNSEVQLRTTAQAESVKFTLRPKNNNRLDKSFMILMSYFNVHKFTQSI